jgi:hypothetical protein
MGVSTPSPLLKRVALQEALIECAARGASSLPFLDDGDCALMIEAARHLTWRAARPVIGEGDRRVLQDFELTVQLPEDGPWRDTAARVDAAIAEAAQRISPNPLPPGFRINDLILQRYAAGSRGITAHRDHIRYRGLVALLILSGDGRFCLCEDRSGASAREIAAAHGHLLLMRAPGYAGSQVRPFHFLDRISAERLSLGMRWDTAAN